MKKALFTAALFALPAVASAQTPTNLTNLIALAGDILNRIIPVLIALALVAFFWGLVTYIFKQGKDNGKKLITAGLLGLFIMVSVWGIIRLAQNTLGTGNNTIPNVPQVPQR